MKLPAPRLGTPGVLVDHPGLVAEFLNELDLLDVIVELVQNELDAGSSRTEIEIGDDALVCSGRGERMSDKGWQRLRYVLGAGSLVDAKIDGIGSKNHGIRACFLLGDQITVQSNGTRIDLTVRGLPHDLDRFYPASWDQEPERDAPRRGVRVIVPYRTRPIQLPDRNPLAPKTAAELDDLFADAVRVAPDRFLCASAPGKPWRYELVLRRRGQIAKLTFAATSAGRDGLSLRTCQVARGSRAGSIVERRQCKAFLFQLTQGDSAKVPALFKTDGQVMAELSWAVDAKGRPQPSAGTYRYPIAFPFEESTNAHGFDVSGPFVAGKARHALGSDTRNADLVEAGLNEFVRLMRETLVPKHGSAALKLIQSIGRTNSAAVVSLAGRFLSEGGYPLNQPGARPGRASDFSVSAAGGALYLREALAEVLPMPAVSVVRFPGLRRSSTGALRLRSTPEMSELRRWHEALTARIAKLATHADLAPAIAAIASLERTLDQMRADNLNPRHFAEEHLSVSRVGTIRPIAEAQLVRGVVDEDDLRTTVAVGALDDVGEARIVERQHAARPARVRQVDDTELARWAIRAEGQHLARRERLDMVRRWPGDVDIPFVERHCQPSTGRIDIERRALCDHRSLAGIDNERSAIRGDLEPGAPADEPDAPLLSSIGGLHRRIGIERDARSVGERDRSDLADDARIGGRDQ